MNCKTCERIVNEGNDFFCPRCKECFCGNCVSSVQIVFGRNYICHACLKTMGVEPDGPGQVTISKQEFDELNQVTTPPPVADDGKRPDVRFEDDDGSPD